MSFVIWNRTQRKYVAPPGRHSSYTTRKDLARQFPSREAAERDCCGDEEVRPND